MQPGRGCPLSYRYRPEDLAAAPTLHARTLYVVGGLYGNPAALDEILRMADAERGTVQLVFNGDFNWFNVDATGFARINEAVLRHVALRGNVETELAPRHGDGDAGCGCAYPAWVADAEVERSNAIMARLEAAARAQPALRRALAALPMYAVAEVAGVRIAIVHGDLESLAGWGYAQEALREEAARGQLAAHFERARVRVIASSHTCLPVTADAETAQGRCVLINNGAAGMPNFAGMHYGVVTRIGSTPAPEGTALYGTCLEGLHIDALAVRYDHEAWLARFGANWPAGSPAHVSYHGRITGGPRYALEAAVRWGPRTPLAA